MAFDVLDEHEQGELVQKWLRENVVSIIIGVALGLLLIFGWQQWNSHRNAHRLDAATQYDVFGADLDKKDNEAARQIAQTLQSDYSDTPYAVLAALRMADVDEAKGNAAGAQTLLENAYQHAGNDAFKTLVGLYLARIEIAQKKADDALKLLDGLSALGYSSLRDELRGDALAALGKKDEARTAYTDALTNLDPNAPNRSYIEMKRNDLGSEEKKGS